MKKISLLFGIFLLLIILIIAKLFYLQIFNHSSYVTDYLKTSKIVPERGRVYDVNNNPLVLNQNSYLLYVEPKKIKDKDDLVRKIDSVLKMGEATVEGKIDDTKYWVAIKSGLDEDQKKALINMKIEGIGFEKGLQRYYPESSLSAHLLGFVGKNDKSEDVGYFGLEGFYDKDLAGLPGFLESERDLLGRPIFIGTQQKVSAENGHDLILNIDRTVQEIIKRKLKEGVENYQASGGCILVADPMTMKMLGMACLPDYDPDKYYEFTDSVFKNTAISDLYEPGSTFKPLVVAAAIQEKKIKPDDTYNETGPVEIGEYNIKTWNSKYEGEISMTRILEKSSNVGMVYIGEKLGDDKLFEYINKFGFGENTGIDLQGEVPGYIRPKNSWYPIDYATATFGQGIAVTPIQMIRAFSSIINGGYLLTPSVVGKISSQDGERVISKKAERRIISDYTSEVIKKMLVSTVENGEIKYAKPKGYTIGGKTGTAQIPIAGHYDASQTIASFIGFAPADKPKFIALVIIRQPKSSIWGSETAEPIFFEIAKELLVYYNIAPEGDN